MFYVGTESKNVAHVGMSFLIQLGVGQLVAWWAPVAGRYPAMAYEAGLLLPMAVQLAALVWFARPRRSRGAASNKNEAAAPGLGAFDLGQPELLPPGLPL